MPPGPRFVQFVKIAAWGRFVSAMEKSARREGQGIRQGGQAAGKNHQSNFRIFPRKV